MILLMTFGVVPNLAAALLAVLAMGLFGCVNVKSAYRSVNWESLILIAGMLLCAGCAFQLYWRWDHMRFDERMSALRPQERAF